MMALVVVLGKRRGAGHESLRVVCGVAMGRQRGAGLAWQLSAHIVQLSVRRAYRRRASFAS